MANPRATINKTEPILIPLNIAINNSCITIRDEFLGNMKNGHMEWTKDTL